VEPDDVAHRDGEEAERIVVPQVLSGREGEFLEVIKRLDVVGVNTRLVESPAVKPTVWYTRCTTCWSLLS